MCKFRVFPSDFEYSSGNKVFFLFFRLFYGHIFCQFLLCITFFSLFSTIIVHNLTFSFTIANLSTKLSFSRKLCSSKKQLYYVTTSRIL
jgi:hypothetical protein